MKVVFVLSCIFFATPIFSQSTSLEPERKISWGFQVGVNYSNILHDKTLPANASVSNGLGARLGLLSEFRVVKNVYFSPKAELSFNNGVINIQNPDGNSKAYNCQQTTMELMTPFLMKLDREKESPYFFIGPAFKFPVNKKTTDPSYFPGVFDVAITIGIGLEKPFSDFKFSPEFRYSHGLLNQNNNPQLKVLYAHSFSLVLKFLD